VRRTKRNPYHVSVEYDAKWTKAVAQRFDNCFGEPTFFVDKQRGADEEETDV
jgi:hypothetical protein